MEDRELTELLKEMLVAFNREARLVSPKLEGEMCLTLDRVGGRWLLGGLQARGVDGVGEFEVGADGYRKVLRTEAGHRQLQSAIEANGVAIKAMRRKLVSLIGTLAAGGGGLKLDVEPGENRKEIYRMLLDKPKGGGQTQ